MRPNRKWSVSAMRQTAATSSRLGPRGAGPPTPLRDVLPTTSSRRPTWRTLWPRDVQVRPLHVPSDGTDSARLGITACSVSQCMPPTAMRCIAARAVILLVVEDILECCSIFLKKQDQFLNNLDLVNIT